MRARNRLTAGFLKNPTPGKHCDGAGLWLYVRPDGGAQWVLRYTVHGRRREMGLGGYPTLGLAEARKQAERWRSVAAQGRDPIKERDAEARKARREDISLAIITADAFEARKAQLKGDGKAGRWLSPLELHVLPKLGRVPITDIDQRDIRDVLASIWHTKADTARKAMNRLGIVIKHAAALGLDVDLQVTAKAKALLGKSRHVAKAHPSIPWREVPTFYASLGETQTELALRLLILTGLRSTAIRMARLDEFEGDIWTVPAENVKGIKGATEPFRLPISTEAQRVIDLALPHARNGFLFPNSKQGVISDMTMSQYMKRRGITAVPHGFRATIRTWLEEAVSAPHEVAETIMQHKVDSAVVRAYRRTDFLDKRRPFMQRWGEYLTGGTGEIVRLAR